MINSKIRTVLSSDPDYEKLIVEMYYDDKFIALLNQDDGLENVKIEFPSPCCDEQSIISKMSLQEFEECLEASKNRLLDETSIIIEERNKTAEDKR